MDLPPRKVRLKDHGVFWFLSDEHGDGPLAPLEHCDEEGSLHMGAIFSTSYAHVFSTGEIKRYHEVIGHVHDLEDMKEDP